MHHPNIKGAGEARRKGHHAWPNEDATKDPISHKKLRKGDGTFETTKCLLGFDLDGVNKTIWLEEAKRAALLTILHQ